MPPAGHLVPGNADPQALLAEPGQRRPGIGIQILLPEPLRFAVLGPLLESLIQVKPRPEYLERVPVILAAAITAPNTAETRDAEHLAREPRSCAPESHRPGLAHIEENHTDHTSHPMALLRSETRQLSSYLVPLLSCWLAFFQTQ
jgi:hypothetical protein